MRINGKTRTSNPKRQQVCVWGLGFRDTGELNQMNAGWDMKSKLGYVRGCTR